MTFSVRAALDRYVAEKSPPRPPDGKYHPSGMFSCARKTIYELRGTQETDPRDERSHRVLFVGSRWHEIVQAAVESHGGADEVYTEVPVDVPELNITGHADQLVRLGDRWELQEFKSISSRGFSFLKGAAKPEHVEQASVYLWGLRNRGASVPNRNTPGGYHLHPPSTDRIPNTSGGCSCGKFAYSEIPPLGDKLDRIRFVYISKDDLRIEELLVFWTPDMERQIKERIAYLDKYRNDPVGLSLPPRLPVDAKGKRNWLCNYCPFATRCWDVDPAELPLE